MTNCLWCNKLTNANSKTIAEWESATFWVSTAHKNSLICKECWNTEYAEAETLNLVRG